MTRFTYKLILGSIIAILLTSVMVIPLEAQTGSLRLEGIVWDPSGNPLSGAALMATEESTGHRSETVSDSDGYYRFLALQPGVYTVTAKAKGFKDVIHRQIYLFTPGSTSENISFEVSAIDKEVGPSERARTQNSDVAAAFSRRELDSYPLLNRNPLELLVYQPGVQINGGSEDASTVNGTQMSMNSLRKDGISVEDPITPRITASIFPATPDSISDLQIVSTAANAEYGGAGGGQVVMTSRPGSKIWTGSIYDYFRNKNMDANDFFNNLQGLTRPGYTRNLFGGVLSGRVGKKTLVFGSFEGNRTEQQVLRNRLVLTDDAKDGLFQWYRPDDTTRDEDTVKNFDIAAHDPRGLGIDPTVVKLLKKLPDTNNFYIGDGLNTGGYEFFSDIYNHQERADVRVDHDLNSNHRLFFRFNWERIDATDIMNNADAAYPNMNSGTYASNDFGIVAGSDYTISPTMVNELRIGFLRTSSDYKRPDRTSDIMLMSSAWTDPLNTSFPKSHRYPAFEITDNLSHARNLHAFKYGFSLRRSRLSNTDYSGTYPTATFNNDNGNVPLSSIGPSLQSEISETDRDTFEKLYNSLLGRVESLNQTFYSSRTKALAPGSGRDRNYATLDFSGFVQDNWKIRPNLTLNLGVRYEFRTVPKELNGYQDVLDKASLINSSANISDFKAVAGNNWYGTNLSNFAPRVGLAWDPFGTGSTVIRGSYGIFYDPLIGGITNFVDNNSYGFSQDITVYPNSGGTDVRLRDGLSIAQPQVLADQPAATRSFSIAILDPNLKTPRIHQMQLTLERRLFGLVLEAGYTRTRGTKLFQYLNLNQTKTTGDFLTAFKELQAYRSSGTPVSASNPIVKIFGTPLAAFEALEGSNFDSGQAGKAANILDKDYYGRYAAAGVSDFYIRNFPQFDKFMFGTNSAESWYDALRIGIRKSTANYGFRAYYTWSKSLDTSSTDGSSYASSWNSYQPKAEKGFSDFNRTHVLNVAYDYVLPFGRNMEDESDLPGWVNALFAGWNLGTLWTYESGARFSVTSGLENQYSGVTGLADLEDVNDDGILNRKIGGLYSDSGTLYWFDPTTATQFTYPEAGRQGTSGRNAFTGPKYFNLDIVIHKKFFVRDNRALQFRLEAYNVFNKTHFAAPNTNLSSSNFGTITSTQGNPRLLQAALRYQF